LALGSACKNGSETNINNFHHHFTAPLTNPSRSTIQLGHHMSLRRIFVTGKRFASTMSQSLTPMEDAMRSKASAFFPSISGITANFFVAHRDAKTDGLGNTQ